MKRRPATRRHLVCYCYFTLVAAAGGTWCITLVAAAGGTPAPGVLLLWRRPAAPGVLLLQRRPAARWHLVCYSCSGPAAAVWDGSNYSLPRLLSMLRTSPGTQHSSLKLHTFKLLQAGCLGKRSCLGGVRFAHAKGQLPFRRRRDSCERSSRCASEARNGQ